MLMIVGAIFVAVVVILVVVVVDLFTVAIQDANFKKPSTPSMEVSSCCLQPLQPGAFCPSHADLNGQAHGGAAAATIQPALPRIVGTELFTKVKADTLHLMYTTSISLTPKYNQANIIFKFAH